MGRSAPVGRWAVGVVTAALTILSACGDEASSSAQDAPSVEEEVGLDAAGLRLRQHRVEELIRDCMKAAGFEYTPVDPVAADAALLGSATLAEDEFTRQFGYGIATLYERRAARVADPNRAIRDALSPADRAAYDRTLRGENQDATFREAVDSGDFSRLGGCTARAAEQAFGGAGVLTTLIDKLDDLDRRIDNDQRMVTARRNWVTCMRDQGYDFTEPDDIDRHLQDRLAAIVGDEAGGDFDRAALAALGQEEVALAKADYGCEDDVIGPVEDEVRPEYESRFRAENADLLSATAGG